MTKTRDVIAKWIGRDCVGGSLDYALMEADSILSALREAGKAVVDVEATEKMKTVGSLQFWDSQDVTKDNANSCWQAMLAAAGKE